MKRRLSAAAFLLHGSLSIVALAALLPFAWMLLLSVLDAPDSQAAPSLHWPWLLTLNHYVNAWRVIPLAHYYANSILVASSVMLGQVSTAMLAGYVFARLQFRGRDLLFLLFLGTLLVPTEVTLVPSFLLMRWLGWVDRLPALTVPFLAHPTAIFLLRQYLLTIPSALEDAARMDGCTRLQVLWHVFIPLALPAAGVVGAFSFLWTWKAFVWPLVIIQTPARYTIPVGLAMLQSELGTNWPLLMAATALATLPVLLIYALVQRRTYVLDFGF